MELSQIKYLLTEALVLWFPFSVFCIDTTIRNSACSSSEDCSQFLGKVACDKKHHRCYCTDGHFELSWKPKCVAIAVIGEACEDTEQCQRRDSNSICTLFDIVRLHNRCQCRASYEEEEEVDGFKKCVAVRRTSFLMGSPHFDRGDTVPIAMGCLAAGLALAACCAGIVQLIRKKNGSRNFRFGESQLPQESIALNRFADSRIPQESITLNGFSSSQLCADPYTAVCITRVSSLNGANPVIIPPSPSPLPLEDDLPPSYEEATKQMAPYLPVILSQRDKI